MWVTSEAQGYIPNFDEADFNALNPATLLGNIDNMLDAGNSDMVVSKLTFEGKEEMGPEIALADYVERCSTQKIVKDKLKQLRKKFRRPENCETLLVPQVNPLIWRELPKHHKTVDVQLQALQSLVAKELTAIIEMKDGMLQFQVNPMGNPNFLQDTNSRLNDGIALLERLFLKCPTKCRDLLKPHINPRYQALCGPSTPITSCPIQGQDFTLSKRN